jgi:hypothetical protein
VCFLGAFLLLEQQNRKIKQMLKKYFKVCFSFSVSIELFYCDSIDPLAIISSNISMYKGVTGSSVKVVLKPHARDTNCFLMV